MRLGEVLRECGVRVRPWDGAELECGPLRQRTRDSRIVQSAQLVELLPSDHERGQVRGIYREEYHCEHRPHVRHEASCKSAWGVHVHRSLLLIKLTVHLCLKIKTIDSIVYYIIK